MRKLISLVLLFVLLFPAMEIYAMFQVAEFIGWWLLAWLIFGIVAGRLLIKGESMAMLGRLASTAQSGQSPFAALWKTGRTMLAGVLLIFPGVLSDVIALILLLWPSKAVRPVSRTMPDDNIVEGEVIEVEAKQIEIKSDQR
jgi:UPF0716 protein FxsA